MSQLNELAKKKTFSWMQSGNLTNTDDASCVITGESNKVHKSNYSANDVTLTLMPDSLEINLDVNETSVEKLENSDQNHYEKSAERQRSSADVCNHTITMSAKPGDSHSVEEFEADVGVEGSSIVEKSFDWTSVTSFFTNAPAEMHDDCLSAVSLPNKELQPATAKTQLKSLPIKQPPQLAVTTKMATVPVNNRQLRTIADPRSKAVQDIARFESGGGDDDFNLDDAWNSSTNAAANDVQPTLHVNGLPEVTVKKEAAMVKQPTAATTSNQKVREVHVQPGEHKGQGQTNKVISPAQTGTRFDEKSSVSKSQSHEVADVANKASRTSLQSKDQQQADRPKWLQTRSYNQVQQTTDRSDDKAQVDRTKEQVQAMTGGSRDRSKDQGHLDRRRDQEHIDRSYDGMQTDRTKEQTSRGKNELRADQNKERNTNKNLPAQKSVHPPFTLLSSRTSASVSSSHGSHTPVSTASSSTSKHAPDTQYVINNKTEQNTRKGGWNVQDVCYGQNVDETQVKQDVDKLVPYIPWSDDDMPPLESAAQHSAGVSMRNGDRRSGASANSRVSNVYQNGDRRNDAHSSSEQRRNDAHSSSEQRRNDAYGEIKGRLSGPYLDNRERRSGAHVNGGRSNGTHVDNRDKHQGARVNGPSGSRAQHNGAGVNRRRPLNDDNELFVGNLDNRMTEGELMLAFEPFGATATRIIRKEGKVPFGFVTFPTWDSLNDAWSIMDGNRDFYNRPLNIKASYRTCADEDAVRKEQEADKRKAANKGGGGFSDRSRQAAWQGIDRSQYDEEKWRPKSTPDWSDGEDDWQPRKPGIGLADKGQRSSHTANTGSNYCSTTTYVEREALKAASTFLKHNQSSPHGVDHTSSINLDHNSSNASSDYGSPQPGERLQSQPVIGFYGNQSAAVKDNYSLPDRTEPVRLSIGRGHKLPMSANTSHTSPGINAAKTVSQPQLPTTQQQFSQPSATGDQRAVAKQSDTSLPSLRSSPAVATNSKAPLLSKDNVHNTKQKPTTDRDQPHSYTLPADSDNDLDILVKFMVTHDLCPMMRGRVPRDCHNIISDLCDALSAKTAYDESQDNETLSDNVPLHDNVPQPDHVRDHSSPHDDVPQPDYVQDSKGRSNMITVNEDVTHNASGEAKFHTLGLDCVQQEFIDNMLTACTLTFSPYLNFHEIPTKFEAVISYVVDDGYIWVQPTLSQTKHQDLVMKMTEQVSQAHLSSTGVSAADIIGKRCFAPFDNKWYRAWAQCWVDAECEQVRVFYIDFGNVAVKRVSELLPASLNARVWSYRPLAVPCHLREPLNNEVLLDLEDDGTRVTFLKIGSAEGYVIEVDLLEA